VIASATVANRDIDVLCVSRIERGKNLPMIARALKVYRAKYPTPPVRMTLIAGRKGAFSAAGATAHEQEQLSRMREILGRPGDYIDFVECADHYHEMPAYYGRAKVLVLGALLEGKNRAINEALSCNTPVVCFQEFNQFARQGWPVFPEGAGAYAIFDPESLADTLHSILTEPRRVQPRCEYLRVNGRRNFLRRCLDVVGYYAKALPEFAAGLHDENLWLDLAVHDNYGVSLLEFLYGVRRDISVAVGHQNVAQAAAYFADVVGN
jgi:glycosyltransferase involved in cell wall biosynthesis